MYIKKSTHTWVIISPLKRMPFGFFLLFLMMDGYNVVLEYGSCDIVLNLS